MAQWPSGSGKKWLAIVEFQPLEEFLWSLTHFREKKNLVLA